METARLVGMSVLFTGRLKTPNHGRSETARSVPPGLTARFEKDWNDDLVAPLSGIRGLCQDHGDGRAYLERRGPGEDHEPSASGARGRSRAKARASPDAECRPQRRLERWQGAAQVAGSRRQSACVQQVERGWIEIRRGVQAVAVQAATNRRDFDAGCSRARFRPLRAAIHERGWRRILDHRGKCERTGLILV
jgi:hypothetical protein